MVTIVYTNGGDTYLGEHEDNEIDHWKKFGKDRLQDYLYKGFNYYDKEKRQVCVFDTKEWSKEELKRRRKNGLLGIKKYKL